MSTNTPGVKHAELVINYEGGTARVMLDGEGLGDTTDGDPSDPAGPADPRSYYTCSTGTGSAGWPLAIALFVIGVRRRRRA
jgi:MYXO-CTERM domain-containing protein